MFKTVDYLNYRKVAEAVSRAFPSVETLSTSLLSKPPIGKPLCLPQRGFSVFLAVIASRIAAWQSVLQNVPFWAEVRIES